MINVTKPFLPPKEQYQKYVDEIWQRAWLTNNGPLLLELENQLQQFLNNPFASYCSNGTVALQIAIKSLELNGEIITTPFSYVATSNSILWENCTPVFVDIREDDFCINAELIEEKISEKTTAIMAVHVYGMPCDVTMIEQIAGKNNVKVIYDAAHAFGVQFMDKPLLSYGDISTCSFHSTKLFHTIEGGAVVCSNKALHERTILHRQFGHSADDYFCVGINGKNSEFHAAMGLCNLPYVPEIINRRKALSSLYDELLNLGVKLRKPASVLSFEYNYAYYPVLFESELKLLGVKNFLHANGINTRRYFYPSLNTLPFLKYTTCPVSEDIAKRILALPLYYDLEESSVKQISQLVNSRL